ncbi:MAG: phosphotransferase family protein [Pseudomonadota bacterium]
MGATDLPEGVTDWLEAQGAGRLCQLERHVARREAWLTAIERGDGSVEESFLRLERKPVVGTVTLEREARICAALAATDVPAPRLLAWDAERRLALFERVGGTAAIDKLENAPQQRAVMEDFIDAIARLHQLQPASLGLEDLLGTWHLSAARCALDDLDAQLATYADFLRNYRDPLLTYGTRWLRRFAPSAVARVSLVQGDTGPVNFMFEGDRVSALVDWEWGHWGDPMEDLGNICVREFWNPSGGLKGLFERYESKAGIPYDRAAAMYYRVQQNVRGMIPIHAVCQARGLRESMAWYLAYRYIGDRASCEAIAAAMGIEIERPTMPDEQKVDVLADAALHSLAQDIEPALTSGFARSRAKDLGILLECLERRRLYGSALASIEVAEMAVLLGQPVADYQSGIVALCQAIDAESLRDEDLVPYLARRAYREEWLHWPVTTLYPDRQWSVID